MDHRRHAEAEEARERAETVRLTRQARLTGWSGHGVDSFSVKLVKNSTGIDRARDELASGGPTAYVVLRVTGCSEDGYVSRGTTAGEKEALCKGLDAMGIPTARLPRGLI